MVIVHQSGAHACDHTCDPSRKVEMDEVQCATPNLPTNISTTKIAWLKLSRRFPMDMRIPPLRIKILLESNPLKSRILVRRLAVYGLRQIWPTPERMCQDFKKTPCMRDMDTFIHAWIHSSFRCSSVRSFVSSFIHGYAPIHARTYECTDELCNVYTSWDVSYSAGTSPECRCCMFYVFMCLLSCCLCFICCVTSLECRLRLLHDAVKEEHALPSSANPSLSFFACFWHPPSEGLIVGLLGGTTCLTLLV